MSQVAGPPWWKTVMLKRLPNADEDEDAEGEDFDDEGEHDFRRWPAFIPWDSFFVAGGRLFL